MESPAETCNPEMIENGPVSVTAMHQLPKHTNISVCQVSQQLTLDLDRPIYCTKKKHSSVKDARLDKCDYVELSYVLI